MLMYNTNTLYAVYKRTAIPDEIYPVYNAGYNLNLVGHVIVSEDEQEPPCDPEEFEMKALGSIPKESKIC